MIYPFILIGLVPVGFHFWHRRVLSALRTKFEDAISGFDTRIHELEVSWGKVKVDGKTVCVHCGKLVEQWFVDGYGRNACANCKPEAFAHALRSGTVQK